ncbi:lactate dehydrogenase [Candidatus Magnetomorum sp. HK-1]|nr:lactate dehydrogenase [Candidatus Magnetomorum sp. HK-1]
MKILFAASENAWGGFFNLIRAELPQHHFEATGGFHVDNLKGFDVLIPTMCPITEEILEKNDRLKLIQQCGSGLESVNIQAAVKRDIWVANVPTDISGNADSVAEMGIFMMLGLSRDLRGMSQSLLNRKMGEPQGRMLSGKNVGIIGLGGIGQALIKRLRAFNVNMIGIKRDNIQIAKQELNLEWIGKPEDIVYLLKNSDFVILCLPYTPESHHLINHQSLSYMKQSSFLINLSRGGLIDHEALKEALAKGKIAGAGLDVFWEEPPDPKDTLFKYNVIATPHVAGSTDVSMKGIVKVVAENIRRLENKQEPLYINK